MARREEVYCRILAIKARSKVPMPDGKSEAHVELDHSFHQSLEFQFLLEISETIPHESAC